MSAAKKKAATETVWIRATRPLDVDQVVIPEGDTAEIRAELFQALADCGAAEKVDPPAEGA